MPGFATMLAYLRTGGVIMLPLVLVSLLLWGVIIYRLLLLRQLYCNHITEEDALAYIEAGNTHVPTIFQGLRSTLLRRFLALRSGEPHLDRFILDEAAAHTRQMLRQGLSLISVLAAVAPLLGLLGTVLGMIGTFECIAVFGNSNARAMAGGISEALVTTQTGLLVAIPGLFMRNFLQRRADNLEQRLDSMTRCLKRHLVTSVDSHGYGSAGEADI